ncbi:hypothetical protein [Acrocarpospora sp. B8E8]|uniref:hypothetical protein n=1 Tax=Acrocarpospora sp. B8E8 TaxID=3153572 RepID=UPI00325F206A
MRPLPAALAVLSTAALAACSATEAAAPTSAPPSPSPITITGTVSVAGGVSRAGSSECALGGGYRDIAPGTQVVVTDPAGKTIALGKLGGGQWSSRKCVFAFMVREVPPGHQFYGVEVSHRGRLQYPAEQVVKPLSLTLGD